VDEEEEEFEPADEPVEEFETVEEEKEPEAVEEFEGFDEDAPDDIASSGFKTKGGEIPDYEPTVDEVLSYAMGKTRDPAQPAPRTMEFEMDDGDDLPQGIEDALDEILDDISSSKEPEADVEEADEPEEADAPEEIEGLDEAFDDEEEEEV
jgi:hypothetical protein